MVPRAYQKKLAGYAPAIVSNSTMLITVDKTVVLTCERECKLSL